MKDFFKPEDFETQTVWAPHSKSLASIANEKLNKLIESWPVVYGFASKAGWYKPDTESNQYATHKARLAFIEKIEKECVRHEPVWENKSTVFPGLVSPNYYGKVHCHKCGVELQATWSEKK